GGRYVRLTAGEKAEVIRLVEGSDLSVRRTLAELGVHRSTFYAWYRRYAAGGVAGLAARTPAGPRYWDRLPGSSGNGSSTRLWRTPNARRGNWRGSSPIGPGISCQNPASIAS